jgi:hypothetical protein
MGGTCLVDSDALRYVRGVINAGSDIKALLTHMSNSVKARRDVIVEFLRKDRRHHIVCLESQLEFKTSRGCQPYGNPNHHK